MKIEATAEQIRALLRFAQLNAAAEEPGAHRRGQEPPPRGLPGFLLERYQSLSQTVRRPVVAAIERGACSGCHVRLPTMLEYKAVRSLGLYTCPHCRRMLYAQELLQKDSQAAAAKSPGRDA
jgi:predicted  nucleic acid-binding Zn-ribbon protein